MIVKWDYLTLKSPSFNVSGVQVCGKRRNGSSQAVSSFSMVFYTGLMNFLPFSPYLKVSSANSFSISKV